MTNCLAIEHYTELCTAYGRTTLKDDVFGDLIQEYLEKGIIKKLYHTDDDEICYEFADGSDLEIWQTGDNHMGIKGMISNGLHMGRNYQIMPIQCNYL